jgi:putative ABC transport system permease protein
VIPRAALVRAGLRDLARRPLQTGLLVLGVALGVAVVVAIDLANASARRGLERSTEALVGRATHQVKAGPSGLPEELLARIRAEAGVRASAPVVEGSGQALDLDEQPVRILGVDPFSEAPFREHLRGGSLAEPGFVPFFTDPRGVVMSAPAAEQHGLRIGSPLRVRIGDRDESLEIVGLLRAADRGEAAALEGLLVMDVGSAQRLLRQEGRLTRIELRATPEEAERVARLLPPGAWLAPAREAADMAAQLSEAFSLNLRALSLLALVVGMFLIYNTVTFTVVQRRTVIGTLRALGVTPAQMVGLLLLEAALASAAGALAGVGLGWLLGQGAVRLVTRTINDLYFVLAVSEATLTSWTALKGAGLGIGAGVLAAVPAALEASRVEPVAALRPSTLEARSRRLVPRVALAGVVVALLGAILLLALPGSLPWSFAALFAIVFGLALLTPLATLVAMRALAPAAEALAGATGRLAARGVTRAVGRTGVAIAALMVAVSVTIGVGLMIGSFRRTVEDWLELSLRADVFVAAFGPGTSAAPTALSAEVPARVAAVPGVEAVERFRLVAVGSPQGDVVVTVADPRRPREAAFYRSSEGGPGETWARVREGAVLVSEPYAIRHRVPARGGSLTLRTDRGARAFPVAGIFYDYAAEQGLVLMSRDVYEEHWDDRGVTSLGVYVARGRSADEVAGSLRRALAGRALRVTSNRSLRAQALRVFDRTFAVTAALRLLAVVVAFIGVWSALMALQLERRRELATLRALGLTRGRLSRLALLESGLMGLLAGALSLPTGLLLAVILIDVINVRSFGWTMRLWLDPAVFAQALLVSVLAALLGSVYPLLRLGRMEVAPALRQE